MQPYAPVVLPFGETKTVNEDLAAVLTDARAETKGKEEIFLMQFPRALPIEPKEEMKKKGTISGNVFDMFKQIRGKIGKLKVYKSGKVEMEIEGVKYLVNSGIQSKMRQEVAAVDRDCRDIYMLGEVGKKMVLTPDIDSLLESYDK